MHGAECDTDSIIKIIKQLVERGRPERTPPPPKKKEKKGTKEMEVVFSRRKSCKVAFYLCARAPKPVENKECAAFTLPSLFVLQGT